LKQGTDRTPIEIWENKTSDKQLALNKCTYIEVDRNRGKWGDFDEPQWMKYFGDGDLEIVSIAWDDYRYLHLWRNDARRRER